MSHRTAKRQRAEAILGELTELGLMLARDLAETARETKDASEKAALNAAFHKTSRMVRLNLALDAKLDRDAARDAREAAQDVERLADRAEVQAERDAPTDYDLRQADPIEARKTRVGNLLNRLVWNECEGDSEDFEVLIDDLTARLDEAALSEDFETLPIEVIAQRMIADMGLSGELKLSLSEPPPDARPSLTPALADTG